jgi:hypothetical protein
MKSSSFETSDVYKNSGTLKIGPILLKSSIIYSHLSIPTNSMLIFILCSFLNQSIACCYKGAKIPSFCSAIQESSCLATYMTSTLEPISIQITKHDSLKPNYFKSNAILYVTKLFSIFSIIIPF